MTCWSRPGGRPALLQVRTVDRTVDYTPDPWGVHVFTFLDRPSTPLRSTKRSTDWQTQTLSLARLTGRSIGVSQRS